MKIPKTLNEILFLQESNNIEDVWDGTSLMQAMTAWKYLEEQKELDEEVILHTHKILMEGKLDKKETGAWRKCAVWIGGHEGKPWFAIPELIRHWIMNTKDGIQNGKNENPIYLDRMIQQQHVEFEGIHPFIDGNGRMGRILMNWTRVQCKLPILVIYEKEKYNYYKWFM